MFIVSMAYYAHVSNKKPYTHRPKPLISATVLNTVTPVRSNCNLITEFFWCLPSFFLF